MTNDKSRSETAGNRHSQICHLSSVICHWSFPGRGESASLSAKRPKSRCSDFAVAVPWPLLPHDPVCSYSLPDGSQSLGIERELICQIKHGLPDLALHFGIGGRSENPCDQLPDDFHFVFLHAPGCHRGSSDANSARYERRILVEGNSVLVHRNPCFLQRLLRFFPRDSAAEHVHEHQVIVRAPRHEPETFR